jgi:NADH dehydrogenase
VFQPLLYQVATSVLTPSQIATPIRSVLRNHKNTTVILGKSQEWTRIGSASFLVTRTVRTCRSPTIF